jgi:hypothetical protein
MYTLIYPDPFSTVELLIEAACFVKKVNFLFLLVANMSEIAIQEQMNGFRGDGMGQQLKLTLREPYTLIYLDLY